MSNEHLDALTVAYMSGFADGKRAAKVVPEGYVLVPRQAIEDAIESLGNFTSDLGWGEADMQAMDNLIAVLAAAPSKENGNG